MPNLKKYTYYYKQIGKLGLPILVGQIGMIIVGFADNIMVGRYSTEALASASFVNNIFNLIIFCCIGFTYGILPLAGALYGQNDSEKEQRIGALMRNAAAINIIYSLALTLIMTIAYFFLPNMGQPEELLPLIKPYYLLFLVSILPVGIFNAFAQWSYSIKNTVMPMWIILAANVLNVAGNYALIYGKWGCPELGLTGAGISTLIARCICPIFIIGIFFLSNQYRRYRQGFLEAQVTKSAIANVWRTSIPVSMQLTFESGSFSVAAIMSGWLGTVPLAAFQIIVIVGTLGFALYYAIGSAIAVLVSNEAGTAQEAHAAMRRAGWAGYHVMLALACCSIASFIFFAEPLMHLFTEDMAVLAAALGVLFPLVLYQLGDATQITFANALRGTGKVMPMLWIAFVSYMIVGIPATYILGFPAKMGLFGILLSFSVSLFLAGALFLIFFLRATKEQS